jgi:hypothetical protein
MGCLFVLLNAVGAVGGTVLLICTLATFFRCFQSEHPRTPDFEIAVVVQVGFITDYSRPRTIIAQALVRRVHSLNFKLVSSQTTETSRSEDPVLGKG